MSHQRVPQPFSVKEPIDYEDGREALSKLADRRKTARDDLEAAGAELVEKERLYRKGRGEARVHAKATTAQDRKEEIDDKTTDLHADLQGAKWKVDILEEKLKEIDAQRASVHKLIEWSMKLDPGLQMPSEQAMRRAA